MHRVNVDRPLEANLLAVRGVPVGDRQPPGAVAAVFEGGHFIHRPYFRFLFDTVVFPSILQFYPLRPAVHPHLVY